MTGDNGPHSGEYQAESDDRLDDLRTRVEDALRALPVHFRSATSIEGIQATDLFALNTVLAATIETRVVKTLNMIRGVWDPHGEWSTYSFERQAQTFPDVRLVSRRNSEEAIALGIELKGWYLLAKERVPSLRFTVNQNACAPHDLIAVFPWYLSNVLSGVPTVLAPWIHSAREAAQRRNHWWANERKTKLDTTINPPAQPASPYPRKPDEVSDKPTKDGGQNFGRLARTGIMDDFLEATLETSVAGITARHWINFFRTYSEPRNDEEIDRYLQRQITQVLKSTTKTDANQALELIRQLSRLLGSDS